MDLGDILRVIGKRWYIMLPMALVTIALTVTAYLMVPMKYQSSSQISLLSPQERASGAFRGQSNPFLIFDTSLTSTADLLARSLSSADAVKELKSRGVTEEYTAKLADFAQGPFLALTVTGVDKRHVLASTTTLTSFARDRLQQIQEQSGVPEDNMIQTTVMIPPEPPQAMLKQKLQSVVAVFGGGMVVAFMATFIVEGLARSRVRNGPARPQVAGPAPPAEPERTGTAPTDADRTMVLEAPTKVNGRPVPAPAPREMSVTERFPAGGESARRQSLVGSRTQAVDPPTELLALPHEPAKTNGKVRAPGAGAVYRSASMDVTDTEAPRRD